ncbi:MAG: hypothetical protein LBM87_05480 [Ruminococcus sp.]|nr:hypothetical protein [Ruminococcus sp.]
MKQKKKKKIILISLIITAVIFITFALTDLVRTRYEKDPLFAVPLLKYDSGSIDYYGLGYKVYKDVNFLNGDINYYYAVWFVPKFLYVR